MSASIVPIASLKPPLVSFQNLCHTISVVLTSIVIVVKPRTTSRLSETFVTPASLKPQASSRLSNHDTDLLDRGRTSRKQPVTTHLNHRQVAHGLTVDN